jgi:hypothetical protein
VCHSMFKEKLTKGMMDSLVVCSVRMLSIRVECSVQKHMEKNCTSSNSPRTVLLSAGL